MNINPEIFKFMHFNSHAHVERDLDKIDILRTALISTHTLTWSVTYAAMRLERAERISTHTLTWSVTVYGFFSTLPTQFQLTRSRGA